MINLGNMPRESIKKKKNRVSKMVTLFKKEYPKIRSELNFSKPLETLVATQLSAQCTDKRVNIVTKVLFKKYKTATDYRKAPLKELEKSINSINFFRNKARHIKESCKIIDSKYKGRIPKDFKKLNELPGVGRKTAHVVMGNAFGIPSGVVVDTHVRRLANRMGFVSTKNVDRIEEELRAIVPQENWISFSHWLQAHGRKICTAHKMYCQICFLSKVCPKKTS